MRNGCPFPFSRCVLHGVRARLQTPADQQSVDAELHVRVRETTGKLNHRDTHMYSN